MDHPTLKKWDADIVQRMGKAVHPWIEFRLGIWACYDVLRGCKLPEVLERVEKFLADRKPGKELDDLKRDIAKAKSSPGTDSRTNPEVVF